MGKERYLPLSKIKAEGCIQDVQNVPVLPGCRLVYSVYCVLVRLIEDNTAGFDNSAQADVKSIILRRGLSMVAQLRERS